MPEKSAPDTAGTQGASPGAAGTRTFPRCLERATYKRHHFKVYSPNNMLSGKHQWCLQHIFRDRHNTHLHKVPAYHQTQEYLAIPRTLHRNALVISSYIFLPYHQVVFIKRCCSWRELCQYFPFIALCTTSSECCDNVALD